MRLKIALKLKCKIGRFFGSSLTYGCADTLSHIAYVFVDDIAKSHKKRKQIMMKIATTTVHEIIHFFWGTVYEEKVHALTWAMHEFLDLKTMKDIERFFDPPFGLEISEEKEGVPIIDID